MDRKPDDKIAFLTATQVKWYRRWLLVIGSVAVLFLSSVAYQQLVNGKFFGSSLLFGGFMGYYIYRVFTGIKHVEFDRRFLYVTESGFDVVVPLDNIKKVEIKNMGGIYKITFFDPIQSGQSLFFKPSLIYPLDFKKQDEKVNRLKAYAWHARKNQEQIPPNALTS